MSRRPDAFMPLYPGDWLGDTMRLTRDQQGGYFLLVLDYWRQGEAPPDDDAVLAAITRATAAEWKKLRPALAGFFDIQGGRWVHTRVERELAKAQCHYDATTQRAKAGAAKRWGKQTPEQSISNAQALPEQCQPHLLPSPSGKGSKKRRAAAQSQTAAPPAASSEQPIDTRWEAAYPKWLKVRQQFGDALWLSIFAGCRPNGSETTLVVGSKFWAEKLETQFSDTLERIFGVPVKFQVEEKTNELS